MADLTGAKTMTLRITPEMHEQLRIISQIVHVPVTEIVRIAIEEYLRPGGKRGLRPVR